MRTRTFESLHAQHERAARPRYRCTIRTKARQLAAKLGVPVPAWAAPREREPAKPKAKEKAAHGPGVLYSSRKRERAAALFAPAAPIEIPRELSAWRVANRQRGAIVCIGRRGVALHLLGEAPQRFRSVADAVAAVAGA